VSIADRRSEYETAGLDLGDVVADPIAQWWRWYDEAVSAGVTEPNAFTVATVDPDGVPDARIVLVRAADADGFSFFTNYDSAKSQQLASGGHAAMVFGWLQLHRQIRVRGSVRRAPVAESDEYFASRPRGSQLGAWASPQSQVIAGRGVLDERFLAADARYADTDVPRPEHWGGWRIQPTVIEFWQGRPSRLHDRLRYTRTPEGWKIDRLAP
jgi:pyridoxamine 5'-phosphate oxidase